MSKKTQQKTTGMIPLSFTMPDLALLKFALESHIDRLENIGLDVQADEYSRLLNKIDSAYSSPRIEDIVGHNFFAWAEEFFTEESGRLNCYAPFNYLIQEYNRSIGSGSITSQLFIKKMIDYSVYKGWEFNPEEIQTGQGRVIKSCNSLVFDRSQGVWVRDSHKKAQSMLYIQTPGNQLTERIFDPTTVSHDS